MFANFVLMAVLALAPPAVAQDAPSAEAMAAARDQADRIIAAAEAEGVFENITHDALPRLKHLRSGMTCVFDPGAARNNVHIYPVTPATPERGDNVSCGTNFGGAALTTYATHLTPMPSVDDDMRSTIDSIMQAWPDAQGLDGEFQIATADGQEKPAFAAVTFIHPSGQEAASFALISHVETWSFKLRATGLVADAQTLARISSLLFSQSLPQD
jgi:hypothetical protein